MILMPLGAIMDYFVYPEQVEFYFKLRLLSSLLVGLAWVAFVVTGKRYDRCFGVMWYLIPTLFISWMIYNANDPASPYYAGLNIVLLALGLLSPWTYRQNILSSLLVVGMYLAASFLMEKPQFPGSIYNNLYFLVLTAIIVGAGSYAHYRQRYRESELKWELNKNRRIVEESNRKLKELDQAKSRFFANISHELRTPLTLLLAPLETLIHRLGSEFDQGTRNLLGTMHANGMRLLKLINDLLDLVRLESGSTEVEREPVQVAEFMLGLASALRQVAEDKKIQLVPFADPALGLVQADRDKLEKIVLNLTFNALMRRRCHVCIQALRSTLHALRTRAGPRQPRRPVAQKRAARSDTNQSTRSALSAQNRSPDTAHYGAGSLGTMDPPATRNAQP